MADVCGPWTLDQLDQFGDLDSLNFSLDSPIWSSADTCILEGAASISGTATTLSVGGFLLSGAADVSGTATTDASGGLIFAVGADVSASATISGVGGFLLDGEGSVLGEATTDATGGFTISSDGNLQTDSDASGAARVTYISGAFITGLASLSCTAAIFGEEWSEEAVDITTWTQVSEGTDQWQSQG